MSGPGWDDLTAEDVDRLTTQVLRHGSRARPELRRIRLGGVDAVVKDYGRRGTIFKRLLGAWLARREAAALRRAEGVSCVPRILGRPQPWTIITEFVDATPVARLQAPQLDATFFACLTDLIVALHERGIAHGDLEHLDNILVTPEMQPAVVDFAAAVMTGSNPLAAFAWPYVADNDFRAICKLKAQHAPELLSEDDRCTLERRSAAETWFRRARRYVRGPVKALATDSDEDARS